MDTVPVTDSRGDPGRGGYGPPSRSHQVRATKGTVMTEHNIGPGAVEEAAGVQQTTEDDEPTPRPGNDPATAEGGADQDDDG